METTRTFKITIEATSIGRGKSKPVDPKEIDKKIKKALSDMDDYTFDISVKNFINDED